MTWKIWVGYSHIRQRLYLYLPILQYLSIKFLGLCALWSGSFDQVSRLLVDPPFLLSESGIYGTKPCQQGRKERGSGPASNLTILVTYSYVSKLHYSWKLNTFRIVLTMLQGSIQGSSSEFYQSPVNVTIKDSKFYFPLFHGVTEWLPHNLRTWSYTRWTQN
jgi:hypothetical protein